MSRVGKSPVTIASGVQVSQSSPGVWQVKGPKGTLTIPVRPEVALSVEGGQVVLQRKDNSPTNRALHGLYRALVQNAVVGVSKGFTRSLELVGVGYRAAVSGRKLELSLGFSHQVQFPVPEGIEIKVEKQTQLTVTGANRELVGQVAANIRNFRPPEPYLGKGIKYADEKLRRKEGKSSGK